MFDDTATDLGGPATANRVYSGSYSENRPVICIFDFGMAPATTRNTE